MSDNIDMEMESLLRHKIRILTSLGIESPMNIIVDLDERVSNSYRIKYTARGKVRGKLWSSLIRTWDEVIADAKAAVGQRELDE